MDDYRIQLLIYNYVQNIKNLNFTKYISYLQ